MGGKTADLVSKHVCVYSVNLYIHCMYMYSTQLIQSVTSTSAQWSDFFKHLSDKDTFNNCS